MRTGISRQFGFLQFADLNHSTTFLERNYPSIKLCDQNGESASLNVAYSREREDRPREDADWICGNVNFMTVGPFLVHPDQPFSVQCRITLDVTSAFVVRHQKLVR
jgi:hypothetical protein